MTSETPSDTARFDERTDVSITVLLLVLYVIVFLRVAWVGDDAYITFRTVDNFVNGYGLTWNTFERVQAYTNPLWMFLMSGAYALTSEIFYTAIGVGLIVSVLALWWLGKIATNTWTLLAAATPLIASKAFVEYPSSGLENPLTHLLLAVFVGLYLYRPHDRHLLGQLSLIAALSALNRLDSILLYLPALAYLFWQVRHYKSFFIALAGATPLIGWLGFSTIYYGFPFPNTAYAKLAHGIPGSELAAQGLHYLLNSLVVDPVTLLMTLFTLGLVFATRTYRLWPFAIGIIISLLYVVRVGGDFMSGRFLTPAFFLAMLLLASLPKQYFSRSSALVCTVVALTLGLLSPFGPLRVDVREAPDMIADIRRISDERGFYVGGLSLAHSRRGNYPQFPWITEGLEEARLARVQEGRRVVVRGGIGVFGYHAGPSVDIIDFNGLADPLLARLPASNVLNWHTGHFRRLVPNGYIRTIAEGEPVLPDPNLNEYYRRLSVVTQGDIFSRERFTEIWRMNTGKNQYLLEPDTLNATLLGDPKEPGTLWDDEDNVRIYERGVDIIFSEVSHPQAIEFSLDHNDAYIVVLRRNGETVWRQSLRDFQRPGGLALVSLPLPSEIYREGFDTIHLRPIGGDGRYSLGHVRLVADR